MFSSDPSAQSFSPLQNKPRSIHWPSPQANECSGQRGSSVFKSGLTLRSLFLILQFRTASFQSHVCFSISKNKPAGQRIACRPWMKDKCSVGLDFCYKFLFSRSYRWSTLNDITAVIAISSYQTEPFTSILVLTQLLFEGFFFLWFILCVDWHCIKRMKEEESELTETEINRYKLTS